MADLSSQSWVRFGFDPLIDVWAAHADLEAQKAAGAPAPGMLRCDGTWFVGVNALPNDEDGRLPGGPPLAGAAIDAARAISAAPFDCAQASVCYADYPRKGAEESEAAFRYRLTRDAAHVDGLLRVEPGRRRKLRETHAYILGVPLNDPPAGGAPLVVWEGSHEIMRAAFRTAFVDTPPEVWPNVDLTDIYHAARRDCFERTKRVEIAARRGEAYLVHRLALHGVASWAGGDGRRSIAYFRPDPGGDPRRWLDAP